jgi:putative ABC transport system ATP-binding protein
LIIARDLRRSYPRGKEQVHALDGVSFEITRGEMVAVVGPSGSGKTTLLNLLGCLDVPTSGELRIDGKDTRTMGERELTRFRRERVGFVFQNFGLIPTLTVAENVMLPALFAGKRPRDRADSLLERVGLTKRRDHRPHELSGGEMQRTAVARALVNNPPLLLADEPTGNLDTATGESIIQLFHELNGDGLTVIVVTHNEDLAAACGRKLELKDGRLLSYDGTPPG